MASTAKKTRAPKTPAPAPELTLAQTASIPFNQLVLRESNVRRINTNADIPELADDIEVRGLLQSLNVRPFTSEDGHALFEVGAGGRRYRALALLVDQGRLAAAAPVPCIVGAGAPIEEDSLAENVHRINLHPVDQYRAFATLAQGGMSHDDIAARFFVTTRIVAQRLKLAKVHPDLLDAYVANAMTLETLAVFTLCDDQARQLDVWNQVRGTWQTQPGHLKSLLVSASVKASHPSAVYIGREAYEAAGGTVTQDLFSEQDGMYFDDAALLERLVNDKLMALAAAFAGDGWKWIKVGEYPDYTLPRLQTLTLPLSEADHQRRAGLQDELALIEAGYEDLEDEAAIDAADARSTAISEELLEIENSATGFNPHEIPSAGGYLSVGPGGSPTFLGGFVERADFARLQADAQARQRAAPGDVEGAEDSDDADDEGHANVAGGTTITGPGGEEADQEGDHAPKALSAALVLDLSVHKTAALRCALSKQPALARVALIHNLACNLFPPQYSYGARITPLDIKASYGAASAKDELAQAPYEQTFQARKKAWAALIPEDRGQLFDFILALSAEEQDELLALCVAAAVNMTVGAFSSLSAEARATGEVIGAHAGLDMARDWKPTVENYLGRVTKSHILAAVTEACGEEKAALISHLKKGDMAKEAQRMLADTGWLPVELRTAGDVIDAGATDVSHASDEGETPGQDVVVLPNFLADAA